MVKIRAWHEGDIETMRRITWATWLDAYRPFIPEADLRAFFDANYSAAALEKIRVDPGRHGYVAELAGVAVGCARAKFEPEEKRFYLSSLYVLPECQRQGAGDALLDAAERDGWRRGVAELWLGVMVQNTAGLAWYRKRGFQFVREEPFRMGGTSVPHLIGFRKIPAKG